MLLVVITVLAAAFYNLFSELIGGIEVTVVEDEDVVPALSGRRYSLLSAARRGYSSVG